MCKETKITSIVIGDNGSVHVNGEDINFKCGSKIDRLAFLLIDLSLRPHLLQGTYCEILKMGCSIDENKSSIRQVDLPVCTEEFTITNDNFDSLYALLQKLSNGSILESFSTAKGSKSWEITARTVKPFTKE